MATWTIRPITPVIHNESYRYKTYPLGASQDFQKGAPALLTSDGTVDEGGANPAVILGFFTADAADYAWMDDTIGHVTAAVPVALATGEFRGTLEGTVDITTDINDEFGLVEDATGYWTVDRSQTTTVRVKVIGFDDDVVTGDVNPPCTFIVLPANRQVVV